MQNKNCFFQKPQSLRSREIPAHAKSFTELSLQQAKLNHVFDNDDESTYNDLLCRALWGVSYRQIHESPILGFSLPRTSDPIKYVVTKTPYVLDNGRCLDLPGLSHDYYAQPICCATDVWVYVGLESKLFSYNIIKQQPQQIEVSSIVDSRITALAYNSSLSVLVRAGSDSSIQFIDPLVNTQIRLNYGTSTQTNIVSDMNNGFYMIGQTSGALVHYDLRDRKIAKLVGFPNSMLIGLAFNNHTLAISTDSCVQLYDSRQLKTPRLRFEGHNPPSKALAFSPDMARTIVTGGGPGDQTLKVWNTDTGKIIAQQKIDNQICGVHWLDQHGFFVTEGYCGNRVSCWSTKGNKLSMDDSSPLHTDTVLFSAQNPVNKEQLITASSDETLRFWSVKNVKKPLDVSENSSSFLTMPVIR